MTNPAVLRALLAMDAHKRGSGTYGRAITLC